MAAPAEAQSDPDAERYMSRDVAEQLLCSQPGAGAEPAPLQPLTPSPSFCLFIPTQSAVFLLLLRSEKGITEAESLTFSSCSSGWQRLAFLF